MRTWIVTPGKTPRPGRPSPGLDQDKGRRRISTVKRVMVRGRPQRLRGALPQRNCSARHGDVFLMGDVCTRACGFCDIANGRPLPLIPWPLASPGRSEMGLKLPLSRR